MAILASRSLISDFKLPPCFR
ncbi:MAG: hypothetical protein HZA37_00330 [Parcubacteria group bacterium]|nr:hypothetical protein [Parcubacteria group bacterium]